MTAAIKRVGQFCRAAAMLRGDAAADDADQLRVVFDEQPGQLHPVGAQGRSSRVAARTAQGREDRGDTARLAVAGVLMRAPVQLSLTDRTAQQELRDFFRRGAEVPAEWGDWTSLPLDAARNAITADPADRDVLRLIAADLFAIEETVETMWRDAFMLIAEEGEGVDELRRFAAVLREIGSAGRAQVLAHATALRDCSDLEYRLNDALEQIEALEGRRS